MAAVEPAHKAEQRQEDQAGDQTIWVQLARQGQKEGVPGNKKGRQDRNLFAKETAQRKEAARDRQRDGQHNPPTASSEEFQWRRAALFIEPSLDLFAFPGKLTGRSLRIGRKMLHKTQHPRPHHRDTGVLTLEGVRQITVADRLVEVGRARQPLALVIRNKAIKRQHARHPGRRKES